MHRAPRLRIGPAAPLAIDGAIALVAGIAFTAVPQLVMSLLGLQAYPSGMVIARFFGGALIAHGCIQLLSLGQASGPTGLVLMRGNLPFDLLGFALSLFYVLTGGVNDLGWLFAALFGALVVARGYWAVRLPLRPLD